MKTMDELLTKLKQDGHRVAVIAYQLEEYRKLKEKKRDPDMTNSAFLNTIHEENCALRFLWGTLWTLDIVGYISDDEREALMDDLQEGETS